MVLYEITKIAPLSMDTAQSACATFVQAIHQNAVEIRSPWSYRFVRRNAQIDRDILFLPDLTAQLQQMHPTVQFVYQMQDTNEGKTRPEHIWYVVMTSAAELDYLVFISIKFHGRFQKTLKPYWRSYTRNPVRLLHDDVFNFPELPLDSYTELQVLTNALVLSAQQHPAFRLHYTLGHLQTPTIKRRDNSS